MKLYKLGEKSKAICPFCHSLKATTFLERTVPLESGAGEVKNLLVAVCDTCDHLVATPQQSVPRIREAIKSARKTVEARVPRQLSDALMLSCVTLGFTASDSIEMVLFRFFLDRIASTHRLTKGLSKLAHSEDAQGKASARLSIRLNEPLYLKFEDLQERTHLSSSDVCRGILVQIKNDILDRKDSKMRGEIQKMLLLAG